MQRSISIRGKNAIVGTFYRPPDENVNVVLDSLRKLESTTTRENKIFYVIGDFNSDLLRHEQHAITREFVELMFSYLLYPLIIKPFRVISNTTSLIDNIFTNNVTCLSVNELIVNELSGHLPIFSINRGNFDCDTSTKRESIVVRDFKDDHVSFSKICVKTERVEIGRKFAGSIMSPPLSTGVMHLSM